MACAQVILSMEPDAEMRSNANTPCDSQPLDMRSDANTERVSQPFDCVGHVVEYEHFQWIVILKDALVGKLSRQLGR